MIITNEIKTVLCNPKCLTTVDLLNIQNHIESIQGFAELEKELALIEYRNIEVFNKVIDVLCMEIKECYDKKNFKILVETYNIIKQHSNIKILEFYTYAIIIAFHKTNLELNKYNLIH